MPILDRDEWRSTGDHDGRSEDERRGAMSRRRMELSTTQVVASVLATVTGAVVASFLGVGGTIVGAAVISFASTAGGVVYKHYLGRTGERLRSVSPVVAHRAAGASAGPSAGSSAGAAAGTVPRDPAVDPDNTRTEVFPVPGAAGGDRGGGVPAGGVSAGRSIRLPGQPDDRPGWLPTEAAGAMGGEELPGVSGPPTETFDRPGGPPTEVAGALGDERDRGAAGPPTEISAGFPGQRDAGQRDAGWGGPPTETFARLPPQRDGRTSGALGGQPDPARGRRRWVIPAAVAAGIFIVVMAGITVFELVAGKPLDALI